MYAPVEQDSLVARSKAFTMKNDDKRSLTPKLRFPEFRKGKAWEQRQAGELFTNRIEHGEDGLPSYSITIDDGMVKRSSLERKIDDIADSDGNKRVHTNDIAYNMMRSGKARSASLSKTVWSVPRMSS